MILWGRKQVCVLGINMRQVFTQGVSQESVIYELSMQVVCSDPMSLYRFLQDQRAGTET